MAKSNSNPFALVIEPGKPAPALPAWVPPPGYFADVPMLNNPQDVTPAMYQKSPSDSGVMSSPFIMWGGSAVLRDYSDLGAQVYYSGGHEASPSYPNAQFTLICDFSTLRWSTSNVPAKPNLANSFVDGYATDGTPYTPHTYLGLQEMPKAWGGGKQGTLVSFFWAGSLFDNKINLIDVSKAVHGYSQLKTTQKDNADPTKIRFQRTSVGGSYPISVQDPARQGWWVAVNGGVHYTLFVHKSGEITQHTALGGNLANGALVLCNKLNLLIAVDGGYITGAGHRTLHIRNLVTGAVTKSTTLGTVPSLSGGYDGKPLTFHRPDVMGLQWVDELGYIVGIDATVSPPQIVKLAPPASNPATGQWTWSTITSLQHWSRDTGGQRELQASVNAIWSKFRWVPALKSFVYGTAKDRKPQIIRLA